jgi:hypothetical protein
MSKKAIYRHKRGDDLGDKKSGAFFSIEADAYMVT